MSDLGRIYSQAECWINEVSSVCNDLLGLFGDDLEIVDILTYYDADNYPKKTGEQKAMIVFHISLEHGDLLERVKY